MRPSTISHLRAAGMTGCCLLLVGCASLNAADSTEVVIKPLPYEHAFKNPLKGFIAGLNGRHEYATLSREYVRWKDIESSAADGPDKIVAYTNQRWKDVEKRNIKIIPRVFLEWPGKSAGANTGDPYTPYESYFPADMTPRDYTSDAFKQRLVRMIEKMGEAWDNDPRIAFVESGMIGPWGEQHHPSPTKDVQQVMGEAFQRAFPHKRVMVRYPWQFEDFSFGIYWDSFANKGWEMREHVPRLEGKLANRWQTAPMGGEVAFQIGQHDPKEIPARVGRDPTDAVANHSEWIARLIRRWHWTALGWISNYQRTNAQAAIGAERIQKTFGYRFVLDEVRYPGRVNAGGKFSVVFVVRNVGSAPFYYSWPVEVALLDPPTRQPVWKSVFANVDIRQWLPGNFSDIGQGTLVGQDKKTQYFDWNTGGDYDLPAPPARVEGIFEIPGDLSHGEYILALSILDPAGNVPAVRFASANYFHGGRHPISQIGVGVRPAKFELDPKDFDGVKGDNTLFYEVRMN